MKTWSNLKEGSSLRTLGPSYIDIFLIHLAESFVIFHNCALYNSRYYCYYGLFLFSLLNLLFLYPHWFCYIYVIHNLQKTFWSRNFTFKF